MGWTQTRRIYNDGYTTKREEILAEFNSLMDNNKKYYKVHYVHVYGNVVYCALEYLKTHKIFAVIISFSFDKDSVYYRFDDETVGPRKYNVTKKLLRMLSPTDNEYAIEWRQTCWDKLNNKAA